MSEMVIFTRTFDFISWLIPRLDSFPRHQRFGVTKRLQDARSLRLTVAGARNGSACFVRPTAIWIKFAFICAWWSAGVGSTKANTSTPPK
jgi:hypothetical protein